MRCTTSLTLAAGLATGALAHQHNAHQRLHARKEPSPAEDGGKSVAADYVPAVVEIKYELDGKSLANEAAEKGIDAGLYVIVGETQPTVAAPPPPPKPTISKAPEMGAQFIEKPKPTTTSTTSTSVVPVSTSSAASTLAQPSSAPEPKQKVAVETKPKKEKTSSISLGGEGVDLEFPSGEIKCSEFPSRYGAVRLNWLKHGGWAGVQRVPHYTRESMSISEIHTAIAGEGCTEGAMCSYACPLGYEKTQWPKAQGATGQSIGGLLCNNGFLELTRPEYTTLCSKGVGGVTIQNDLEEVVATCRTDYPGTEAMVVPATANPGESIELCNPEQSNYMWNGSPTSAQYYVNKAGYATEDACVWNSEKGPEEAGNWAPVVLGAGRAKDGMTYLSIFANKPTSFAKLNFNIEISGDITSKCALIAGKWTGGKDGCTTGLKPGGKAIFRYF